MTTPRQVGIVGLGRIGGNLAAQALEKGMRVAGFSRRGPSSELLEAGIIPVPELAGFRDALARPRVILIYVPAGAAVDEILDRIAGTIDSDDVLVDGGNSYWGDSRRRYRWMRSRGAQFVDLGTSGGIAGARHGACFMAGGERDVVSRIEPLLAELSAPGGFVHAGPPGSGHYVKLVHNGIEFDMLQAIGEGVQLLERYAEPLDVGGVLRCWRHGSVIRSWLVDLMEQAYRAEGGLTRIPSHVEDTGEVNWLVSDAMRMEVPIPVIAQAVMQLLASRDDDRSWARAIAMMRHGFGGHPYEPSGDVVEERREGRISDFPTDYLGRHGNSDQGEPRPS